MTSLSLPRTRARNAAREWAGHSLAHVLPVAISRTLAIAGVILLVGVLPWLAGTSAEYTVLRARYAELEATSEALAMVRRELGLDAGPLHVVGSWLAGVVTGDLGTSWISGAPVGPGVLAAFGASLALMGASLAIALVLAAALVLPTMRRGLAFAPTRSTGTLATTLAALPSFLLASALLIVVAVQLRWLPPYGWGDLQHMVLPALAMGIPAGGYFGKLLADAAAGAWTEDWVTTWSFSGASDGRLAFAVLRRSLAGLTGQLGLIVIGLIGGAVAVEEIFAIPGLGRLVLGAASAQDIPTAQAGILFLVLTAALVGSLAALTHRLLVGPALASGNVPVPRAGDAGRSTWWISLTCVAVLATIIVAGLLRDPYTSAHRRLEPPSLALPFGADAAGRDLFARVGTGAIPTLGLALVATVATLVIGVLVGLGGRWTRGFVEVTNALPSIIVGLVITAVSGPSAHGALLAVVTTAWAPIAAHCADLAAEARARPYIRLQPLWGVGRARQLLLGVLPAVLPTLTRHAALRLPGRALELAALGFLGLGAAPPSPEWGLLVAEAMPYVERAPWAALAPTAALVLAAIASVGVSQHEARARKRP